MPDVKKNHLLIHAWTVSQFEGQYYLPYTHWIYLREIVKYFPFVSLLCQVKPVEKQPSMHSVESIGSNIGIIRLPYSRNYIQALKYFPFYVNGFRKARHCTHVYVRFPVPFGWLSRYFFRKTERIFHFVGDPAETIRQNPNISAAKKRLIVNGFQPEFRLFMAASKGVKVFVNGKKLQEKLASHGVSAVPLISSTLLEHDFFLDPKNVDKLRGVRFIYVGYLNKAKGVETVLRAFALFLTTSPLSILTIVGTGEQESDLKQLALQLSLYKSCRFTGHIDDRTALNGELRMHDVFLFASVSEGSPRVILEAMANGVMVISTPVGSLPEIFTDEKNIIFTEFNDPESMCLNIEKITSDKYKFESIRKNAFEIAQNFTLSTYIKKIFDETVNRH